MLFVHTRSYDTFMILKLFNINSEINKMAASSGVIKITDEAHFQVIFFTNQVRTQR